MEDLKLIVQSILNWLNSFFRVNTSELMYFTIDVTIPSGTTAGTLIDSNQEQLDRSYNKIIGIAWHEIDDGGAGTNYQVGGRTQKRTWIDPMILGAWQNSNVAPDLKFLKVNIPYGSGDSWFVPVIPGALLTSDLTGQVILILQNDLTELPR